jgi:transketolase
MALAAKRAGNGARVVCLVSDGEMDEGSNWEAVLFAPHLQLGNLVLIVDYNKIQSFGTVAEVMPLEPFADKFRAFRWDVREIDGHDHDAIWAALEASKETPNVPTVILAHTVKGKGVSFMEDRLRWHYSSPNDEQLSEALAEIGVA